MSSPQHSAFRARKPLAPPINHMLRRETPERRFAPAQLLIGEVGFEHELQ
jgi:hypothetical protein